MIYLDSSYLVRLYIREPGWEAVRSVAGTDQVACALHGWCEVAGAFHRKFREESATVVQLRQLLDQFELDEAAGAFKWLPVSNSVVRYVASMYSKLPKSVNLRSADALHLGCAVQNGFKEVYSNDTRFLEAATYFGLKGHNVI